MPKKVRDAKILLLDAAVEVKDTEQDAQIRISSPDQLQAFLDNEEKVLMGMVDGIKKSGATVVFCQKGVDDMAQHFLSKARIYVARRVKKSDMEKLARATGAKIVTAIKDISKEDIGFAGMVNEVKFGDDEMTIVSECKNPKAVTILIRGGTEHVVDEIERAIDDALGDLKAVIENSKVVAGGGAPEMEVSKDLNEYSQTLAGREQLAVKAFAKSLEIIPRTLAENAGIEPIDIMVELKASHEKGMIWAGVDGIGGGVTDMWKKSVIEPLKVKTQAIMSATEVATMILRIDDVIAAGKLSENAPPMPPGGMGGMGGMPPGGDMY